VRLLELKSNLGFSAGNNAGLGLARGELIALLNNDTKAEPGWLEALYKCIKADDRIAACDSRILYYDRPDLVWSSGGSYTISGSVFARFNREPVEKIPGEEAGQTPADVFIAVACAALYRKKIIDQIGFFDQEFFNGYEDVDWSFRAQLAGYRIVNEPKAKVRHKVSATQIHNSPEFVYHGQRNVSTVFVKNMPGRLLLKYWPLHLAYWMGSLVYFARAGRLKAFSRAKRDFLKMLPGTWGKRREIQARRSVSAADLDRRLEKRWLGVKAGKFKSPGPAAG
jgi:hypothetical protein